MRLTMRPWRRFEAFHDAVKVRTWLSQTGDATETYFKSRMKNHPPASAPGAFPNVRSGNLRGSIRKVVTNTTMEIGTGMFYARYLKHGTRKMAKRKMSSDALQETLPKTRPKLRGFARWRYR